MKKIAYKNWGEDASRPKKRGIKKIAYKNWGEDMVGEKKMVIEKSMFDGEYTG